MCVCVCVCVLCVWVWVCVCECVPTDRSYHIKLQFVDFLVIFCCRSWSTLAQWQASCHFCAAAKQHWGWYNISCHRITSSVPAYQEQPHPGCDAAVLWDQASCPPTCLQLQERFHSRKRRQGGAASCSCPLCGWELCQWGGHSWTGQGEPGAGSGRSLCQWKHPWYVHTAGAVECQHSVYSKRDSVWCWYLMLCQLLRVILGQNKGPKQQITIWITVKDTS